ncbi:hypothetical protein BTVI_110136 [Pitangus sulphuratus]|nr:hypothetical protein BTVI_110136 [Pitangus sulphuratus]
MVDDDQHINIGRPGRFDYITLPPACQDKPYMLTMVETATGRLEMHPVPHTTTWNTILSFEKQVLWQHGTPERIESVLPVPPAVGPAFSFELDVEDGEVENYELCAGQFVQKDTVRDSVEGFTEIQKDYINWLPLISWVGHLVKRLYGKGGNQRELARQKNLKKTQEIHKGKRKEDSLSASQRKQRDSEIMQQKQKAANERKSLQAGAK